MRTAMQRRKILKQGAGAALGALGLPLFVPAGVQGKAGRAAPRERTTLASLGVGGMGPNNLRAFRARYANGVELTCQTGKGESWRLEGTDGWIEARDGGWASRPESLRSSVIGPDEIHLYERTDHPRNFVDCIKNRQITAAPVEIGHRSTSICHLGNIATRLGRKLHRDPVAERFPDSDKANRMLSKPMRSPWRLG